MILGWSLLRLSRTRSLAEVSGVGHTLRLFFLAAFGHGFGMAFRLIDWLGRCRDRAFARGGAVHQKVQDTPDGLMQLGPRHDHVQHPVFQQILCALKPRRKRLTDRFLDHPSPGKADYRPRLGNLNVAQHREGGGDAAGGRIGQEHDVGQAGCPDHLKPDYRPRHLHERENTLLHACSAGSRNGNERGSPLYRLARGGHEALTHSQSHGAAHEGEIESSHHRRLALDGTVRNADGILLPCLRAGSAQPVAVAFAVAELEGVGDHLRQFDCLMLTAVEQDLHASFRADTHVMTAVRADPQQLFQLAMKDHVAAGSALFPKIVRNVVARNQRPNLRAHVVGNPVHAGTFPRIPLASARTRSRAAGTVCSVARLLSSRDSAIRLTIAEPTTAASATLPIAAACSGVLMPKPTAIGISVWRRNRSTASAT